MKEVFSEALKELIKNLNSEKYEKALRSFYKTRVAKMEKVPLDEETFVSYIKAYSIKRFLDPAVESYEKRDIQFDAYVGNISVNDIVDVFYIVEKKGFINTDNQMIREPEEITKELEKIKQIVKTCNLQKTLDK